MHPTTKNLTLLRRVKIFIYLSLCVFFLTNTSSQAADYYWVGGSGNWSDPSHVHWAQSSGGTTMWAQPPSSADRVIFDAASTPSLGAFTVTIDLPTADCDNMIWNGIIPGSSLNSSSSNNQLFIYGNLQLDASMVWDFNGRVHFVAPDNSTITSAGQKFKGDVYFNNPTTPIPTWTLQDNFYCTKDIHLVEGTINFNNQAVTCATLQANYTNTCTLNLQNSQVTLTDSWNVPAPNSSSFTLNYSPNATLTFTKTNAYIWSDNLSFPDTRFNQVGGTGTINGDGNTFASLHFDGHARIRDNNTIGTLTCSPHHIYTFGANKQQTITQSISAQGSCAGTITFESSIKGTPTTLVSDAALQVEHTILHDIHTADGPGAGIGTFTAINSMDHGNNNTWNWVTPRVGITYYWNTSNSDDKWSNPNNWSTSSSSRIVNGCIPGPYDNVVFQPNSFSPSNSVIIDLPNAACHSMTWQAGLGNPIFTSTSQSNVLSIYGNLEYSASMQQAFDGTTRFLKSHTQAANTLRFNGQSLYNNIFFDQDNGVWELLDDLDVLGTNGGTHLSYINGGLLTLNYGTLITNGRAVSCVGLMSSNTNVRNLNITGSEITITGQEIGQGIYGWHFGTYTNLSFTSTNSLIRFKRDASLGIYFAGGQVFNDIVFESTGRVYGSNTINSLTFQQQGQLGRLYKPSNNTIGHLTLTQGYSYTLTNGRTQKVTGSLNAIGSCTELIHIRSDVSGGTSGYAQLENASGSPFVVEYTFVQDVEAIGQPINANSSIGLNAPGWVFSTPAPTTFYWVGGHQNNPTPGDKWSDPNNWSTNPMGAYLPNTNACIPGPNDNVVFQDASFTKTQKTVLVDVPVAYCLDIEWTQQNVVPTFIDDPLNQKFLVFGSSDWGSGSGVTIDNQYKKEIHFEQKPGVNTSTIKADAGFVFIKHTHFTGSTKTWNLGSDLKFNNALWLHSGTFHSQSYDIEALWFLGNASATLTLQNKMILTGGSTVNGSTVTFYSAPGFTFNGGSGSRLLLTSSNLPTIKAPGTSTYKLSFNEVEFTNPNAEARIWSENYFQDLTFQGNGTFTQASDIHILNLTAGKTYTFASGKTYTIVAGGAFNATGTPSAPITLRSSLIGQESFIDKKDGSICCDYLNMRDMHNKSNIAVDVYAGQHSSNTSNNFGWAFTTCTPNIITMCVGPYHFNSSLSNGSWHWDFGDNTTSTLPNPIHIYQAGFYRAYVDVYNLNQATYDRTTYQITVNNCCNNWPKTAGDPQNNEIGNDSEVDSQGFVYVTGRANVGATFDGTPVLGPGTGFLAKYTTCGTLVWTQSLQGDGHRLKLSPDEQTVFVLTTDSPTDAQLAAFTNSGSYLWHQNIQTTGFILPGSIDCSDRRVYVSGSFDGTLFLPGHAPITNTSMHDGFVAMYNYQSTFWERLRHIKGNSPGAFVRALGIAQVQNGGHIYLVGGYQEQAIFDSGIVISTSASSSFIAKFDDGLVPMIASNSSGLQLTEVEPVSTLAVAACNTDGQVIRYDDLTLAPIWISSTPNATYHDLCYNAHTDAVYAAGYETAAANTHNVLVAKFAALTGNQDWTAASSFTNPSPNDYAHGIATDGPGTLYLTGTYTGDIIFGSAPLTALSGGEDIFVTRIFDIGTQGVYLKESNERPALETEKAELQAEVKVYPNPSNGIFAISLPQKPSSESIAVEITNVLGQLVLSYPNVTSDEIDFDFTNQPKGMYYIKLVQGDKTVVHKLILQ